MRLALSVHDSPPYIATLQTKCLQQLELDLLAESAILPRGCGDCSTDLAAPRRARISVLQVASSSMMDVNLLKYG